MSATGYERFEQEIYRNWAEHFGCPVDALQGAGTTLLPSEKYAGDGLIVLSPIGAHTFVEFDPAYTGELEAAVAALPAGAALTGEWLRDRWEAAARGELDTHLALYLYPPDLPAYAPQAPAPQAPYALRRLTLDDADAMQALHAANTQADVDEGQVEVSHEVAFGCFAGDRLTAAASGYRRTGFLDIGILTHPDFRRRGLAKAAVGALCAWTIGQGLIAQYRCNVTNTGSHGVALALKFREFFRSECLWPAR